MAKITFIPSGVCARKMEFEIADDGIVTDVKVIGGCPGNALGIAHLAEGRPAAELVKLLQGIRCGNKSTSCPDQLAQAIAAHIPEA